MGPGLAASDIIRSMMREGFSREHIYDVLSGIGLPGEQVQLIIDRVAAEFHDAGLEPRPSRLAAEVGEVFREAMEELKHEMLTRMESLASRMEFVKVELDKLGRRVVELDIRLSKRASGRKTGRAKRSAL